MTRAGMRTMRGNFKQETAGVLCAAISGKKQQRRDRVGKKKCSRASDSFLYFRICHLLRAWVHTFSLRDKAARNQIPIDVVSRNKNIEQRPPHVFRDMLRAVRVDARRRFRGNMLLAEAIVAAPFGDGRSGLKMRANHERKT